MTNTLFISLDKQLFNQTASDVLDRQKKYANALGQLTIIVFTTGKPFKRKQYKNLTIIPTNSRTKLACVSDAYRIALEEHKKKPFDIVSTQDPFLTGLVGKKLKKQNIKFNVQVHTDITSKHWKTENVQNRLAALIAKRVLPSADSIRTVNTNTTAYLKKKYPSKRIALIPIATELKHWTIKKKYDFNQRLITVARLSPEKNISLLINAVAELRKTYPKINLAIIGGGTEYTKLERLIKRKNLQSNIILFGPKKHADIKQLYKTSDVFILPSKYEGWGVAAIEALATGTPVIMTNTGCAGEAVLNGKTGLVFDVGDSNGLIKSIKKLFDNPKLIEKYGKAGKQHVNKYYKPEQLRKQWIQLLKTT